MTSNVTVNNLSHLELLLEGNPKEIDPEKPIEEQTQHLPYDKHWEVPANRLKLGNHSFIAAIEFVNFKFLIE